jgi:hypothetical protein
VNDLFSELKRRNVVRVGAAYAVVGWLIIEVVDTLAPRMAMPEWVPGFASILILIGFPIALLFAWAFEITPGGLKKTTDVERVRGRAGHARDRGAGEIPVGGLYRQSVFRRVAAWRECLLRLARGSLSPHRKKKTRRGYPHRVSCGGTCDPPANRHLA